MKERWNENIKIKECEGVVFQRAVPPPPSSFSNVLGLSNSFAIADTAEEVGCDVLNFPLEDSRAANNYLFNTDKSLVSFSFSHPHMVHLPFLEFAFQIVH